MNNQQLFPADGGVSNSYPEGGHLGSAPWDLLQKGRMPFCLLPQQLGKT